MWLEDLVQLKAATFSLVQHGEGGLIVGVRRHDNRLSFLMLVLLQHRLDPAQHTDVA